MHGPSCPNLVSEGFGFGFGAGAGVAVGTGAVVGGEFGVWERLGGAELGFDLELEESWGCGWK